MFIFMENFFNTIVPFFLWSLILLTIEFSICSESFDVQCIASEREALLNFKQHLKDPTNRLHSWNGNGNCCEWTGVIRSNLTGHVVELRLRSSPYSDMFYSYQQYEAHERSKFGGEISSSLLDLKHMSYIDLSGNEFGGIQIPPFIGSMINLTHLNLSYSNFGGLIPHQLANLSNLCYLNLKDNDLYAKNVQWLLPLSSLQYLDLSSANLSAASDLQRVLQTLPYLMELLLSSCGLNIAFEPSSANFSSLVILDLSDNYYDQSSLIPKWIFGLRKLVSLNLGRNNFRGPIPDGIQNLTCLENLDLSQNLFNSTIPMWLYSFTHLKFLDLRYNEFCGTISDVVGNLTSLVRLALSSNESEGKFPRSLENLCNMREVFLSNTKTNQEVSEILEIFLRCVSQKLEILSMTTSQLSGHLTDQIGVFQNLVELDLYKNSIRGELPKSLGNLPSLKQLSLGANQFIGNPFEVLGSLTRLQALFIAQNFFQGVVIEDHLANFTRLHDLYAEDNQLTLKVRPNWSPCFQLLSLGLSSWQLGPSFPSWIQSQKDLEYLYISNTSISDSIPTWFWSSFTYPYAIFDLSHNQMYGEIQNTLANPLFFYVFDLSSNQLSGQLPFISSNTGWLDLSSNHFSGTITNFLCQQQHQQSNLAVLNLASNNLTGKIPDCWMSWQGVAMIELGNNYFTGSIPTSLGSLPYLQILHLRQNKLSGKFPISLKNSSQLVSLDLAENKFFGVIPNWIGDKLLNLKTLNLDSNNFHGHVPWHICGLSFLQVLDISKNNFSGSIPKCFNQFGPMKSVPNDVVLYIDFNRSISVTYVDLFINFEGRLVEYNKTAGLLTMIDLSHNKLSGEILKEITSLGRLLFLNLSNNLLTGEIPESIGSMRSLLHIDLSRNQLSGEIPQSMTNLSFLNSLDLSFNHLKGEIPRGTQLQSFEASRFIGNELCGPPLAKNCNPFGSTHDVNQDDKDDGHGINSFYVSMAMGFIVGFWAVVGPLFISRSWRFTYYLFLDSLWYKLQYYSI